MYFYNSLVSLFWGDTSVYHTSFDKANDSLKEWCKYLPVNLSEDKRTNTIALKFFDRVIVTVKDPKVRCDYMRRRDFEEYSFELNGIDSKGKEVKWICSDVYNKNLCNRTVGFSLTLDNQLQEYCNYIREEKKCGLTK